MKPKKWKIVLEVADTPVTGESYLTLSGIRGEINSLRFNQSGLLKKILSVEELNGGEVQDGAIFANTRNIEEPTEPVPGKKAVERKSTRSMQARSR